LEGNEPNCHDKGKSKHKCIYLGVKLPIAPKLGVAQCVHARVRSNPNKAVNDSLMFCFRWFSPRAAPLWKCRSESVFYVYFIQTCTIYYKKKHHVLVAKD